MNSKSESAANIRSQIINSRKFLTETNFSIPSLDSLTDLKKSAKRVINAVNNAEKIMIFGHDDMDGITSTYILYDFLRILGSKNHFCYIPNRIIENHGLSPIFTKKVIEGKFDLVITVDGGIKSYDAVEVLSKANIQVIITDHHIVPENLPCAHSIVNPKREDPSSSFYMIAGVTVTYLLICKISELKSLKVPGKYMSWIALGSIADRVPLTGFNWQIVRKAYKDWRDNEDELLSYLRNGMPAVDFDDVSEIVSYFIKLLSNGRDLDGNHKALQLLISPKEARDSILQQLLLEKKNFESSIDQANQFVKKFAVPQKAEGIFYLDDSDVIEQSTMGMIASELAAKTLLPVFVIKEKSELLICEARCSDGFDLMKMFNELEHLFIQYGGHTKAAGFTANSNRKAEIETEFIDYVNSHPTRKEFSVSQCVDAVISWKDFVQFNTDIFNEFKPFGQDNPTPILLIKEAQLNELAEYVENFNILPSGCCLDVILKYKERKTYKIMDYTLLS
ncbi:MAG: DHH family phosphoesterase [Candidatus Cloacimonetes bacterium]|nr:DHH family phosphoesterase [Candidatus Cloacimonadota bacterium]